jgi:peptidoglycan/LPS O-acetylase OafA/YrhL
MTSGLKSPRRSCLEANSSTPKHRHALHLTLVVLLAAACISLSFVVKLQPSSVSALVFLSAWLTFPQLSMGALLLVLRHNGKPALPWCISVTLITLGGLYLLVDVIFLHPDPQSAIGVVLVPALQGVAFLIAAPLLWWVGRRSN